MNTIRELLDTKGAEVVTIEPDATVLDAVRLMAELDIGSVAIVEGERLIGLLTERHYARNVVLAGRRSDTTPVRDVMSDELVPVARDATIDRCMELMTERRIRHLPVLDGERLIGIVSIGDLVRSKLADQKRTIDELTQYIAN